MKENNAIMKRNAQEVREDNKRCYELRQKNNNIINRYEGKGIWCPNLESLDDFLEVIEVNRRWAICKLVAWRYNVEADWEFENDDMRDYEVYDILNDKLHKRYWSISDICNIINSSDILSRYEMTFPNDIRWYDGHEGIWQSLIDNMA